MQNICSDIFAACKRLCAHKFFFSDAFVYTNNRRRTDVADKKRKFPAEEKKHNICIR